MSISRKEAWGFGFRSTILLLLLPSRAEEICYNTGRQFNSFAFVALLARVKPGKFYEGPRFGGCVSYGRISFRDFLKGFSRASLGIRWGIAPSLFPIGSETEGKAAKQSLQERGSLGGMFYCDTSQGQARSLRSETHTRAQGKGKPTWPKHLKQPLTPLTWEICVY